jgi:hypothetical protein
MAAAAPPPQPPGQPKNKERQKEKLAKLKAKHRELKLTAATFEASRAAAADIASQPAAAQADWLWAACQAHTSASPLERGGLEGEPTSITCMRACIRQGPGHASLLCPYRQHPERSPPTCLGLAAPCCSKLHGDAAAGLVVERQDCSGAEWLGEGSTCAARQPCCALCQPSSPGVLEHHQGMPNCGAGNSLTCPQCIAHASTIALWLIVDVDAAGAAWVV